MRFLDFQQNDTDRARYRAAYESEAAREWIKNLTPAQRRRAKEIGLLKPYFDPPSYHFPLEESRLASRSNPKATFDENDVAFAALDNGGDIEDAARPDFFDEPETDEPAENGINL
ncbi:MAG: hypothetical protein IJX22_02450 [Opitutales bacterium]|nr:hypothetical protein [Opitutales bacterium]